MAVECGRGLFIFPPPLDVTPSLTNRQRTRAATKQAQFQSSSAGVVYVDKARLLAGLRTSHRQLYVS